MKELYTSAREQVAKIFFYSVKISSSSCTPQNFFSRLYIDSLKTQIYEHKFTILPAYNTTNAKWLTRTFS
jgi:hypothetical protein